MIRVKRAIPKLLLVFFLLIVYVYVIVVSNIPNKLVIFEGEDISINLPIGIKIDNRNALEVSSNSKNKLSEKGTNVKLNVSLLNNIALKNVNVDILPRTKVIPVGSVAGVKLYTNGVLVVGMSEIEGEDKKIYIITNTALCSLQMRLQLPCLLG